MGVGNSGFIQLRRGLSEHVRDGRLSFFEASLYVFILMDANPATGLCYGSAGLFSAVYSVSDRTCRDALEKLELKGYLRRFPTRGKHGSYPILINKFLCSSGAMKGKYVNCEKSSSYKSITYDSCDDSVNESAVAGVNEGVNESAGSKILDTGKEKQKTKSLPRSQSLRGLEVGHRGLMDGEVCLWGHWRATGNIRTQRSQICLGSTRKTLSLRISSSPT